MYVYDYYAHTHTHTHTHTNTHTHLDDFIRGFDGTTPKHEPLSNRNLFGLIFRLCRPLAAPDTLLGIEGKSRGKLIVWDCGVECVQMCQKRPNVGGKRELMHVQKRPECVGWWR